MNEIKNQHVHMFWAFVACFIAFKIGVTKQYLWAGLICGVSVETYQLIAKDEKLKLFDRLLDLSFWSFGSVLFYFFQKAL